MENFIWLILLSSTVVINISSLVRLKKTNWLYYKLSNSLAYEIYDQYSQSPVQTMLLCCPDSPLKGRLKTYVKALISAIDIKSIQMEAKVEREKEKKKQKPCDLLILPRPILTMHLHFVQFEQLHHWNKEITLQSIKAIKKALKTAKKSNEDNKTWTCCLTTLSLSAEQFLLNDFWQNWSTTLSSSTSRNSQRTS